MALGLHWLCVLVFYIRRVCMALLLAVCSSVCAVQTQAAGVRFFIGTQCEAPESDAIDGFVSGMCQGEKTYSIQAIQRQSATLTTNAATRPSPTG